MPYSCRWSLPARPSLIPTHQQCIGNSHLTEKVFASDDMKKIYSFVLQVHGTSDEGHTLKLNTLMIRDTDFLPDVFFVVSSTAREPMG